MLRMIHIATTYSLAAAELEAVRDELRRFNAENNSAFFTARELPANAARPLYAVARDPQGLLLGGLLRPFAGFAGLYRRLRFRME
jgi:hypothetical protein